MPEYPKPGRKLVVANWKMNGLTRESRELITQITLNKMALDTIVICPPYTALWQVGNALSGTRIHLGAQDCHQEKCGAFTGDVSARMLKDQGCGFVILGHSERRRHHHETDTLIEKKTRAAWAEELRVVLCVGETEKQRAEGRTLAVIEDQLRHSVPASATAQTTVIAYEPVWAIGTGNTATVQDIAEVHSFINHLVKKHWPKWGAMANPLYGGSVKAANAASILSIPEVGGVLVGSASLDYEEFKGIVEATALEECLPAGDGA